MIKKTRFISKQIAAELIPEKDMSIISISHDPEIQYPLQEGWQNILRVVFFDNYTIKEPPEGAHLLTDETVRTLYNFIEEAAKSSKEIVVHCSAGISRSAGVAKYIAYRFKLEFDKNYDLYHRDVYNRLLEYHHSTKLL